MKLTKTKLKRIIQEELKALLNEKVEIGDTVKHKEYGQGTVRALRSDKGMDRVAVVSWDKKGEKREATVGSLTIVKKVKKEKKE